MGFGFDMNKAKEIHKENIRFAREEKLKAFQKELNLLTFLVITIFFSKNSINSTKTLFYSF